MPCSNKIANLRDHELDILMHLMQDIRLLFKAHLALLYTASTLFGPPKMLRRQAGYAGYERSLPLLAEDAAHRFEALGPLLDQLVFDPVYLLQVGRALLKLGDETVETLQVGLRMGAESPHECHYAPELFTLAEAKRNVMSSL